MIKPKKNLNFPVLNKGFFQAFFDLVVISLSYSLSFLLVFRDFGGHQIGLFIETIPLVLALKLTIFYLSHIYKGSWHYSSVEDILMIVKAVFLSSAGSIIALSIIFGIKEFGGAVFFMIDFYLLFTFAFGYRISYRVLSSVYGRNSNNKGKKILIYGAGHRGSTVLKEIRRNDSYLLSPVGFIDDDREKKGRVLHNCPILGSIEDIEKILSKREVSEIIVSTDKIRKDKINKLLDFCRQKGIMMRHFKFMFYELPR